MLGLQRSAGNRAVASLVGQSANMQNPSAERDRGKREALLHQIQRLVDESVIGAVRAAGGDLELWDLDGQLLRVKVSGRLADDEHFRAEQLSRLESLLKERVGAYQSADIAEGTTFEGTFNLNAPLSRIELAKAANPLAELQTKIAARQVLETGGAWDVYRGLALSGPQRPPAARVPRPSRGTT